MAVWLCRGTSRQWVPRGDYLRSEKIDVPICHHHVGTGAPIWFVPGKRAKIGRGGADYSLRR
jgi:hypothetical protein